MARRRLDLVAAVTVLDCGCGENWKRGYHAAIGTLFAGAALYNGLAFCRRPSLRLALMTGLYVVGVAGETYVCSQHRSDP